METNVQTDKKVKKSKKFAAEAQTPEVAATAEVPEGEVVAEEKSNGKGSGAPRPRKWEYGIIPEAKIVRQADTASVKKEVAEAWACTDENPTVEAYTKLGGDRHGLRVLSRRGLIKIVHPDGTEFPQPFVAKVSEPGEAGAPAAEGDAAPTQ